MIAYIMLFLAFSGPMLTIHAMDLEISESSKCSKLFPYFERKLRIPSNTLHSIALKESGKPHKKHKIRLVWPWTVNVEGQGAYFASKREAVQFVKKQIIQGKENIDVGCMQINLKHHLEAFDSIEQAFDPKVNVRYGAEFLRSKYDQLGNWHCAIAHYHSATPTLGAKYRHDVVKIAKNMRLYKASLYAYSHDTEQGRKLNDILVRNLPSRKGDRSAFASNKKNYKSNMMVLIPRSSSSAHTSIK